MSDDEFDVVGAYMADDDTADDYDDSDYDAPDAAAYGYDTADADEDEGLEYEEPDDFISDDSILTHADIAAIEQMVQQQVAPLAFQQAAVAESREAYQEQRAAEQAQVEQEGAAALSQWANDTLMASGLDSRSDVWEPLQVALAGVLQQGINEAIAAGVDANTIVEAMANNPDVRRIAVREARQRLGQAYAMHNGLRIVGS
jgi:hypothetical protein